jgi:STE24 endopeptidase
MSDRIATCIYRVLTPMDARLRGPLAVAAAVAATEAAARMLRPRSGRVAPEPVALASYFSRSEVDRARRFRRGQLALAAASSAGQVVVLAALARRPPAALRHAGGRPVARSAAAAAALAAGLGAVSLPAAALARRRALAVGLSTRTWSGWAADVAKAGAVEAAVSAAGGAGAVALMRRAGPRWWIPGSALAVGAGALATFAAPVLLEPLFLRFAPLDEGPLRQDVLALAAADGVAVRDVLVADASRRTSGANAYVSGIGRTRRIVLFDTLLRDFDEDEVRLVVAHELSHVRHHDVLRGLAALAIGAPASLRAVAVLAGGGHDAGPATLPGLALAGGAVAAAASVPGNALSRAVEVRADVDALRRTGAAEAFAAFHRRIALRNVADPAPPRWRALLTGTHPTTLERIGLARAVGRAAAADGGPPSGGGA